MSGALPSDRATRASTKPASGLGHSAGIPSAGPWRVSAGDEHQIFDEREYPLVSVPCGGLSGRTFDEAARAARVIAAAPDLLIEGERLISSLEAGTSAGVADAIKCLRTAIAKARGET